MFGTSRWKICVCPSRKKHTTSIASSLLCHSCGNGPYASEPPALEGKHRGSSTSFTSAMRYDVATARSIHVETWHSTRRQSPPAHLCRVTLGECQTDERMLGTHASHIHGSISKQGSNTRLDCSMPETWSSLGPRLAVMWKHGRSECIRSSQ